MKILRIRAGSVIINHKNEILLIFRKGKWDLPKGKASKKGKLLSVAINESIEETGLKKKNLKLIKPLNSPTTVPNAKITINANQGGTPREINDINPRFVAPIRKGIERSKPPNITTNV